MGRLKPTDKDMSWYLKEIEYHGREISELLTKGKEIYKDNITCKGRGAL